MKKLLKLLFVLSSSTTLPLTVIACGQESLDPNLNIIYNDDTKYNINDIFSDKQIQDTIPKSFSLSSEESQIMAKEIVKLIFEKNELETTIPWYDETTDANQKCYNFTVHQDNKDKFIWDVNAINGSITIKISYFIGSTDNQKNFVAHQKIDKFFEIKVAFSESDKRVANWINEFNNKIDWDKSPLQIDLSKLELDLPKEGTPWTSLDRQIKNKTYQLISNTVNKFESHILAWFIKNTEKNLDSENKLELQISANLDETSALTKTFYIQLSK